MQDSHLNQLIAVRFKRSKGNKTEFQEKKYIPNALSNDN